MTHASQFRFGCSFGMCLAELLENSYLLIISSALYGGKFALYRLRDVLHMFRYECFQCGKWSKCFEMALLSSHYLSFIKRITTLASHWFMLDGKWLCFFCWCKCIKCVIHDTWCDECVCCGCLNNLLVRFNKSITTITRIVNACQIQSPFPLSFSSKEGKIFFYLIFAIY